MGHFPLSYTDRWTSALASWRRGIQSVDRSFGQFQLQRHFPTWTWETFAVTGFARASQPDYYKMRVTTKGAWLHARDHDHDTLVVRYAKVDQVVRNKWATLSRMHLLWTLTEALPRSLCLHQRALTLLRIFDPDEESAITVPEVPMQSILRDKGGGYWRGHSPWHISASEPDLALTYTP